MEHTNFSRALGAAIKHERKLRSLGVAMIAEQVGVSGEWLCSFESGLQSVGVLQFLLIAAAVGFDPYQMLREHFETHFKGNGGG